MLSVLLEGLRERKGGRGGREEILGAVGRVKSLAQTVLQQHQRPVTPIKASDVSKVKLSSCLYD